MLESDLTKKIAKKLRDEGAFAVKIHGGPHQPKGLPDIIGCFQGRMFGLEVKVPGKEGTLTELQAKKLRDLKAVGAITGVVTTVREAVDLVLR